MKGLKPGWGISVLGETPTLFAWGLESPEHEAGNEHMSYGTQPFCVGSSALGLASVDQGYFPAIHQSRAQARPTAPVQGGSTQLNQDPQEQSQPSKWGPVSPACHCGGCGAL